MTPHFLDAGPVWWGYMSKCSAFLLVNHRLPSASSEEQSEVLLASWMDLQRLSLEDPAAYVRRFGPHKCDAIRELFSEAESFQLAINTLEKVSPTTFVQ